MTKCEHSVTLEHHSSYKLTLLITLLKVNSKLVDSGKTQYTLTKTLNRTTVTLPY